MSNIDDVDGWLKNFARCVRDRDYTAACALVAPAALSFGTVEAVCVGRSELEANQWRRVWHTTNGFTWCGRPSVIIVCDSYIVIAQWTSWTVDNKERRGRATIVLQLDGGVLQATHTHFSLNP